MENKKQLIIVPPMSEPLQKLHEVLNGIAVDENIDISLVDEIKELVQFLGSAGQSLIVFSNAKKCAVFLQENRFLLAKNHSKVILLTPKEIPPKTMVKFVKIGLTESILENSPPKTLIYKVKLLLRSIKSSSATQDDKDQVVKSMLDATGANAAKDESAAEKAEIEVEESLNYLSEERLKNKKDKEENAVDYGENLKGKNNYQEESIDTNWKSKRKTEELKEVEKDADGKSISAEDSNIDMYYRKKKANTAQAVEEDNLRTKKSLTEEVLEESDDKKRNNFELDLLVGDPIEKKKKQNYDEEDGLLSLKSGKKTFELESAEEAPIKEKILTEEEKAIAKKKEFDELEELFEAAKKRQAMAAEELGGHYKGKLNTNQEEEEEDELKEEKEYDNSDLYQKKEKQFELDLLSEDEQEKRRFEEEETEEKNPHEGEVDKINTNMTSENGSTDKINTMMMSELGTDASKQISTHDTFDIDKKKEEDADGESDDFSNKKKLDLLTADSEDERDTKKALNENETEERKKNPAELEFENSTVEPTRKKLDNNNADDSDIDSSKKTNLQLLDGEIERSKTQGDDLAPHMAFKKLDQQDVDDGKNKGAKTHSGKADKIDTYYRGGEAKKTEHSWDNLTGKTETQTQAEKAARKEDEVGHSLAKKDNGEITIDYRKLKEEFDYISKNGASEGATGESIGGSNSLIDTEDAGSFKVVEVDARGFIFSTEIINLIYQKDSKPIDFYKKVSEELITQYKAYSLFYTYKVSDKKHVEAFDSFMHFGDNLVDQELKVWRQNTLSDQAILDHYFSQTMTTWLCRTLADKSGNGGFWQDVELPGWAAMELSDKSVEMVFPYFDGVDRMGIAVLIFPYGVNPNKEKSITVTLELVRTVLLDSIQRSFVSVPKESSEDQVVAEPKNIKSLFAGLFNRKKAG